MTALILVTIILLIEHFTHRSALQLAGPILQKIWSVISYFIAFLFRMNEPFGKKS